MLPDDSPIGRDVKAEAKDPFGNITGNPSMANLMADPLGTEIVAGLTGPMSAQNLPTDTENVMGQPPQVNFAKALVSRNWKWVFAGAGVVVIGGVMLKRKK